MPKNAVFREVAGEHVYPVPQETPEQPPESVTVLLLKTLFPFRTIVLHHQAEKDFSAVTGAAP